MKPKHVKYKYLPFGFFFFFQRRKIVYYRDDSYVAYAVADKEMQFNFTWTDMTEAKRTTDHSRGQVSLASSAARWPSTTSFQRKAEGR